MHLNNIRIILISTSHPGNIGATARAMKNMGLQHLYLVTPQNIPNQNSYELAAGADDLINNAVICSSLEQALSDCHLVYATSARAREISLPGLLPNECAQQIAQHNDQTKIAIVFGNERSGLSNQELILCHYHVHIPSNPHFSSLNLAQAVQIIAYELRMNWLHLDGKQAIL